MLNHGVHGLHEYISEDERFLFPSTSVPALPVPSLFPIPLAHIRGHYKLTVL